MTVRGDLSTSTMVVGIPFCSEQSNIDVPAKRAVDLTQRSRQAHRRLALRRGRASQSKAQVGLLKLAVAAVSWTKDADFASFGTMRSRRVLPVAVWSDAPHRKVSPGF